MRRNHNYVFFQCWKNLPGSHIKYILAVILSCSVFVSCENDIEVVKLFSNPEKAPDISMENIETIYSDSAKIKGRLVAPILNKYEANHKKYSEFPKGIHVYFYNDSVKVNAEVSAKYAIYYEKTQLWEARNDVVVINTSGDKLNTEQLFWDQNKKIIYTKKYCRITKVDGTQQFGEGGMEAREDFSQWTFFGSSGTIYVKNAEE